MGVPAPTKMVEAWAANAPVGNVPGGKTVPIPVASQIPLGLPGRASLNDGFTPANMTPLNAGGIPMSGPDTNGMGYLLSTTIVSVNGGMVAQPFDGAYATAIGGYDKGAIVRDATDPTLFWTSLIATNGTDPATANQTAWYASRPQYSTSAPTVGTHADNVLPGASDYFLDISTAAGNILLNGFIAQRNGQRLVISNTGANLLQLGVAAGSAGNQLRANAGPATILQNDSLTIQYAQAINSGVGGWVIV